MAGRAKLLQIPSGHAASSDAEARSKSNDVVVRVDGRRMLAATSLVAQPLDKVTFGTNWVAQAEHGGFYQALADGTYRKHGLDVTLVPGGPNVNHRLLLTAGKIDFYMSANTLQASTRWRRTSRPVPVAAISRRSRRCFMAHPDQGIEKFEDLKTADAVRLASEGVASYFQWLKADFGFGERQVKPYTFNPQPFLADKRSAMQGYVTSEPFAIETAGRASSRRCSCSPTRASAAYSTLIETRRDLVDKQARPGAALRRCLDRSAGTIISMATIARPTR